jgi:cation diffusion facilitator family transporter
LKTDVYTSLGVAVGFFLIYLTGYIWLDSIIAVLVAVLIIFESYSLLNNAFSPLVDTQLPVSEVDIIKCVLEKKLSKYDNISYTRLRTRKSGSQKYLDFILFVPDDTTVLRAHDLCDEIEEHINEKFRDIDINIHVEPNNLKN